MKDKMFLMTLLFGVLGSLALTLVVGGQFARATNQLPVSTIQRGYQGQMIPNASASIASGQTASSVIQLNGFSLVGVLLPAAFTGTAMTFQASVDGTNFFVVKSTISGSSLSYTVAQGNYYAIDPVPFYGIHYLKIVSGTAEGAARTLTLALKGI